MVVGRGDMSVSCDLSTKPTSNPIKRSSAEEQHHILKSEFKDAKQYKHQRMQK